MSREKKQRETACDMLSVSEIGSFLNEKNLKDRIVIYDEVGSTNDLAKQYAKDSKCRYPIERIFIANAQTSGRGRQGRSFYSPPGSGVYMSILLCPHASAEETLKFTTAASVAVCRAIENAFGLRPQIKWVNDIYLNNKKVCGILAEAVTDIEGGCEQQVVIGIGVNTSTESFPAEIGDIAGSLCPGRKVPNRNRFIAEIINSFVGLLKISETGMVLTKEYVDEYKKRSAVLGKTVKILNTGRIVKVIDINERGGLVVETSEGIKTLESGEISIRLT